MALTLCFKLTVFFTLITVKNWLVFAGTIEKIKVA